MQKYLFFFLTQNDFVHCQSSTVTKNANYGVFANHTKKSTKVGVFANFGC